jgi:hypothetical protein
LLWTSKRKTGLHNQSINIMIVIVDGVEIHVGPSHKIDVHEGRVVIVALTPEAEASDDEAVVATARRQTTAIYTSSDEEDPPPKSENIQAASSSTVFRERNGMVMLAVSGGAAYWLFSPEETGEENIWVLSDYAVHDEDLAASKPCAPKLFTHYGSVDEDNQLRGFSALPYQYYDYATEGAGRVRRMLDDVFDIALHRGTQQTRCTLEALVTQNTVLEPVERVTTTCEACNLSGRRATFQFGPLVVGRSCAKSIQAAIEAWDAYSSIRDNTELPPVYQAAKNIIQDALTANV